MPAVIYKNLKLVETVTILAGQSESNAFDCSAILAQGATTLRRLILPSNWTTSNVSFKTIDTVNNTSVESTLTISDQIADGVYTLLDQSESTSPSLIPYSFDSVTEFKIVSTTAQVFTVQIGLVFQPIYQGVA